MGSRRKLTPAERERIGQEWRSAALKGVSQREFARQHQLSTRSVRQFARLYAPATSKPEFLKAAVTEIVERLKYVTKYLEDTVEQRQPEPPMLPTGDVVLTEPVLVPTGATPAAPPELKKFSFGDE